MIDAADERTAESVFAEGDRGHDCGCNHGAEPGAGTEQVTLAGDDFESEAPDEDADVAEGADTEDSPDKPRKTSRSRRLKNRLRLLLEENAGLRRMVAGGPRPLPPGHSEPPPRPEEFGNDTLAYDRALHEYAARKAVREERERLQAAAEMHRAIAESRARLANYNERLTEARDRIPDFDRTLLDARDLTIRADLQELIRESPKGPLIAYYLARNLDKLDDLNRMPPVQAAREIGRLETRIRGPQPNTVTKAPPPVSTLKGGTASPARDPSRMSMEDFVKWREAGHG
jgi:hypothetical protein